MSDDVRVDVDVDELDAQKLRALREDVGEEQ